jgi:hypothetical protein
MAIISAASACQDVTLGAPKTEYGKFGGARIAATSTVAPHPLVVGALMVFDQTLPLSLQISGYCSINSRTGREVSVDVGRCRCEKPGFVPQNTLALLPLDAAKIAELCTTQAS